MTVKHHKVTFNSLVIGGSLDDELRRIAEMLVHIADEQGIFFAIAFLYDAGYDQERIKRLLQILQVTPGSVKKIITTPL